MAKIQIKSEKLTPFGGIFSIMEQLLPQVALWGKGILCLRCFCCTRNMYNKMNFVALQAKFH